MRQIAIIGKACNATEAPVRSDVERWGCNDLFTRLPGAWAFDQWDRWFDVHTRAHIRRHRPHAWAWYETRGPARPIYLHQIYREIPGSRAYPRQVIQQAFAWGGQPEELFTSSVDWMLALAIYEQVDAVGLYGIDLSEGEERTAQRVGAHYWIGVARGRGIEVIIPDNSSLCKTERLYGYGIPTSARNFDSMSLGRFVGHVRQARAQQDPAYVAPGRDER